MTTRRGFFKEFLGQIAILRDEIRGKECIPLNRLNELPENIIEQIEPIFFPDENWYLKNGTIYKPQGKSKDDLQIHLDEIELSALALFKEGTKLKQVAENICERSNASFEEIYPMVTSLFFRLAALRICHPSEAYQIDEIIDATK